MTTNAGPQPTWSDMADEDKLSGPFEDVFSPPPRQRAPRGRDVEDRRGPIVEPDRVTPVTRVTVPIGDADLHGYLEAITTFFQKFVAFTSDHQAVAIALWVAMAWLVESFDIAPILAITSAEKQSGKTRTLDVLELLVPHPVRMVLPSEAVTYTILSQRPRPTLLLDEADAVFGPRNADRYEGLRAILNSGHGRGSPVPRVKLDGRRREVEWFDVFGPKVVAGIGDLPDTVADRAIPIRLRRRRHDEHVARFRQHDAEAEAESIRFPDDVGLMAGEPDVPDELPDRAADGWEPLILIADTAGGTWPDAARRAAIALSARVVMTPTAGTRLLGDIKDAFAEATYLATDDLLQILHDLEDAPWGEWYGKPMSAMALAKQLKPYGIGPRQERMGDQRKRGYYAADFQDAWSRYLPPQEAETGVTDEQPWDPEMAKDDDAEGWS